MVDAIRTCADHYGDDLFGARRRDDLFGPDGVATMRAPVDEPGYDLGVVLSGEGRAKFAMKRGDNPSFRSGLVRCPGTGQGAVVLSNGDGSQPIVDAPC